MKPEKEEASGLETLKSLKRKEKHGRSHMDLGVGGQWDSMDCSCVIVQVSEAWRATNSSRLAPRQAAGGLVDSPGQSFGIVLES